MHTINDINFLILAEGQKGYFQRVVVYFVLFTLVQLACLRATPGSLLALRPTIVASLIHAVAVSVITVAVLSGLLDLGWWVQVGLPITMAFNLNDMFFYCIPKRSIMFLTHHAVMMYFHSCVCTDVVASAVATGDATYAQMLSVTGFVAEIPVPFMSLRWIVQKKCTEARMRLAVDLLCLVTWVLFRLVIFPVKVWGLLAPESQSWAAKGNEEKYWICVVVHTGIFLTSCMWLLQLLESMHAGGSKLANE